MLHYIYILFVLLYDSQHDHAHTSLQAPGSWQPTSNDIKLYNNILCYITFTYCLYYYTFPNIIMHTQACRLHNHAHTSLQAPGSWQPTSKDIKLYNNISCYITFTYCLYYCTFPKLIMHTQACRLLGVDHPHQKILNSIIIYYVTFHLHIVCITIRFFPK